MLSMTTSFRPIALQLYTVETRMITTLRLEKPLMFFADSLACSPFKPRTPEASRHEEPCQGSTLHGNDTGH